MTRCNWIVPFSQLHSRSLNVSTFRCYLLQYQVVTFFCITFVLCWSIKLKRITMSKLPELGYKVLPFQVQMRWSFPSMLGQRFTKSPRVCVWLVLERYNDKATSLRQCALRTGLTCAARSISDVLHLSEQWHRYLPNTKCNAIYKGDRRGSLERTFTKSIVYVN